MIVYVNNLMNFINKLKELLSEFSLYAEYKITVQNSIALLYTKNKQLEIQIFNMPFTIASKYKLLRDKSNKCCARFVI